MTQKSILIIKLGALGDVIRTTPLLRVLSGRITWLTSPAAEELLRGNPMIHRLIVQASPDQPLDEKFDLVVNLEDSPETARLAASAAGGEIVGPYWTADGISYSGPNCDWFDMSLSSRFGRARADELKLANRETYQSMVFAAFGLTFQDEDPVMDLGLNNTEVRGLVGLERRAGNVWPTKRWNGYEALAERLQAAGYRTKFFEQRDTTIEYAGDINECEFVVCGDTLAMHIALALGKRVVALFTCTSPHEIYGYGRLRKVVSPLLEQHFYQRAYSAAPAEAISVETVYRALLELAV